jgi:3-oxoadipate enol-lactonase
MSAPLVLVNGYAATGADWDPAFVAALEGSFEVLRPDNHGATIDAMAGALEALLDERGLEWAHVAGWSMGGFIAQRLATRAPQRVASLALLSTDPGGSAATLADPAVWARLTDHSGTPREQATRLLSLLFPPELAPEIDRQFGDIVAQARAAWPVEKSREQEAAIAAWHAEEPQLPGPESPPVLVAHGSEDIVVPPANADALAARWPHARVELFAGGGHAFMAQEPARLAELLTAFALSSRWTRRCAR